MADALERRRAFLNVQGGQRTFIVDVAFTPSSQDKVQHVHSRFFVKGNTQDGQRRTANTHHHASSSSMRPEHSRHSDDLGMPVELDPLYLATNMTPTILCPAHGSTLEKKAKFRDTPFVDRNELVVAVPKGTTLLHVRVLRVYNERHRSKEGEALSLQQMSFSFGQTEEVVTSSILTWQDLPCSSSGTVTLPWSTSDVHAFEVGNDGELRMTNDHSPSSSPTAALVPDLRAMKAANTVGKKRMARRTKGKADPQQLQQLQQAQQQQQQPQKIKFWTGADDDAVDPLGSDDTDSLPHLGSNGSLLGSPASSGSTLGGGPASASASASGGFEDEDEDWMLRLTTQAQRAEGEDGVFGLSLSSSSLAHSLSSPQFSPVQRPLQGSADALPDLSLDDLAAFFNGDALLMEPIAATTTSNVQTQMQQVQTHQQPQHQQQQAPAALTDEEMMAQLDEQLAASMFPSSHSSASSLYSADFLGPATVTSTASSSGFGSACPASPATVPVAVPSSSARSLRIPFSPLLESQQEFGNLSIFDLPVAHPNPQHQQPQQSQQQQQQDVHTLPLSHSPSSPPPPQQQQNKSLLSDWLGLGISSIPSLPVATPPMRLPTQPAHLRRWGAGPVMPVGSPPSAGFAAGSTRPRPITPPSSPNSHSHNHSYSHTSTVFNSSGSSSNTGTVFNSSSSHSDAAAAAAAEAATPDMASAALAAFLTTLSSSENKRMRMQLLNKSPHASTGSTLKAYVDRFKSLVADARTLVCPAP